MVKALILGVKALILGVFLGNGVYFPSLQVLHRDTAFISGCQLQRGLREIIRVPFLHAWEKKKRVPNPEGVDATSGGLQAQDSGQEVARSSTERSFY